LARAGATVLVHGRDPARGEETLAELRAQGGGERATFYRADYASLDEVREMGERIRDEHDALHALVNNAGIGTTLPGDGKRMESRDGHELRFQVNYLAGYLLTRILEPLLVGSAPARIVRGRRRHRELPAPRDLHAHQDGAGGAGQRRLHARGGRRGHAAPGRGSRARWRHRPLLRRPARGPGPPAGLRRRRAPAPARAQRAADRRSGRRVAAVPTEREPVAAPVGGRRPACPAPRSRSPAPPAADPTSRPCPRAAPR
ncbi:MAG: SDR family NAD(P)-dependent oxidoreductase, partial [Actinobacteria bacterium]